MEVKYILMRRSIKVDAKARTDMGYPAGFMDVVSIEKTNEFFRLLYDIRGRFALHRVSAEESKFKLARVKDLAMVSGGKNTGRVGVIVSRERHQGSFDIVHVKDAAGNIFATRLGNVFVIGKGNRPMVSLPKRKGIKLSILEERALRPPKV